MIKEADKLGQQIDEREIECEMRRENYWATIGIGIKDYYT